MNDSIIESIGKYTFGLFFLLGNIRLFGYVLTKNDEFAAGGLTLIILGTVINLIIIISLLIYGVILKSKLNVCLKATGIMLLNVPVAVIYNIIGINIIN
ncbi:branched-chain amino acid:cation transporter, LIVCS family [Chryseobacterium sp. RU37D]|uniref:hypothetical protein n=1 Tax=Chryseobacterium sp. RU37D TaxID=1907397 RepID=UPI0009574EC1|nr:hypothetical protein [Chryseobacterium sp. RU37D]SIQ37474.1 branched-chain amino acid:cation transporter, LIVCS family [Chryseobacterium sp. RU37D]